MNAAEVSNSTGKTLDGGPITVYDAGAYAGEALVETLKAGDKRLIGYGVDLGMRISTKWDSSANVVREIHLRRGTLTTRNAVQETKTYTIKNVDAQAKTLVIEHAERSGFKLLNQTPSEKTSNAYRFEVKVAASAEQTFPVAEERVFDQTVSLNSATPDVLASWLQNTALGDGGRRVLEQIAQKKSDIAANDSALAQVQADRTALTQDESRVRENIQSLRQVAGQQDQVQQYARQLADAEAKLAALRDSENDLRKKKAQLQSDLNTLIDKADF
jgi:chromosome segregation ATPase